MSGQTAKIITVQMTESEAEEFGKFFELATNGHSVPAAPPCIWVAERIKRKLLEARGEYPLQEEDAFDPIERANDLLTLREFEKIITVSVGQYADEFNDANDFTKGKHTFGKWFAHFSKYMSF